LGRRHLVLAAHPALLPAEELLLLIGRREPRLAIAEPDRRRGDATLDCEPSASEEPARLAVAADRALSRPRRARSGRFRRAHRDHHHHRLRRSPLTEPPAGGAEAPRGPRLPDRAVARG